MFSVDHSDGVMCKAWNDGKMMFCFCLVGSQVHSWMTSSEIKISSIYIYHSHTNEEDDIEDSTIGRSGFVIRLSGNKKYCKSIQGKCNDSHDTQGWEPEGLLYLETRRAGGEEAMLVWELEMS